MYTHSFHGRKCRSVLAEQALAQNSNEMTVKSADTTHLRGCRICLHCSSARGWQMGRSPVCLFMWVSSQSCLNMLLAWWPASPKACDPRGQAEASVPHTVITTVLKRSYSPLLIHCGSRIMRP